MLPYLPFGLVIGAWTDRVNRKRLMVVTDLIRAGVIGLLSGGLVIAVAPVQTVLLIDVLPFGLGNFWDHKA